MNTTNLMGRLVADPELKRIGEKETPVVNFTVAVQGRGKDAPANFINCVAWASTAEFLAKYFEKGSPIAIQGRLESRSFENKEGGKTYRTEVRVENIFFVPRTSASAPAAEDNSIDVDADF